MPENTWSKGVSSIKSTSFVPMAEHPFVCEGASFAYSGKDQNLYYFPDLREEFPFA